MGCHITHEKFQVVGNDVVVETVDEGLRSDHEEITESEHVSFRLKPGSLSNSYLYIYEREHPYLSSFENKNEQRENKMEDIKGKEKTQIKMKDMFRKVATIAMAQLSKTDKYA